MLRNKKDYDEKECIICKRNYYVPKKKRKGRRSATGFLRPITARTCSRKCAREYSNPKVRRGLTWKKK